MYSKQCKCGYSLDHDERYDAYYCIRCNEWTEKKCEDLECFYCRERPEKPRKIAYGLEGDRG